MDFRQLVNRVPPKASFTILSDSCHSGGLIDQEKEQIGPSTMASKGIYPSSRPKDIPFELIIEKLKQLTSIETPNIGTHMRDHFKEEASLSFHGIHDRGFVGPTKGDFGILLSGCQTNETSADVDLAHEGGKACGAFSNAVQKVLMQNPQQISNKELVMMAREVLQEQGFKQHPCLYCSDEIADSTFLLQP